MIFPALLLFSVFSNFLSGITFGATIAVPEDYLTIQAAIEAAQPGDTVLVASGTYYENIDFRGKSITVTSQTGPAETVIDGRRANSVVTFWSAEGSSTVLNGFTIRNGMAQESFFLGGGLSIRNASPTITGCHIQNNGAHDGGGIYVEGESSPIIEENLISGNIGTTVGGGIAIRDGASPTIRNNVIGENLAMNGSGVFIANGASPSIEGNTIENNNAGCCIPYELAEQYLDGIDITQNMGCGDWFPSAILVADQCSPLINNNDVTGNIGGGISILVSSTPTISDNNITGNLAGHPLVGGILIAEDSAPILTGNTIEYNQAGAIWIDSSSSILDAELNPISLEGFSIIEDSHPAFTYYGQWDLGLNSLYSGGTRRASGDIGATASVSFVGTGVSLIWFADSGSGIADITIDGIDYPPIDTYSPDNREESGKTERVIATDFSPSEHFLTITVSGRKNPLSSGHGIVLDAIGILPRTSVGDNRVLGSVYTWPPSSSQTEGKSSDNTLLVPEQYGTIQEAIEGAGNGDTIIVSPGVYRENLNFLGKNIVVRSRDPAEPATVQTTIIDAQDNWPTVTFAQGEGRKTRLQGFTIQNGLGQRAVQICGSIPTISNNILKDSPGGAIFCAYAGSPLITTNVIENNGADSNIAVHCSLCSAEISNNLITGNTGCGISSYFSKPVIIDNTITNNTAKEGTDSGIYLDHVSPAIVRGNNISQNKTINVNMGGDGIILDFFSNSIIEGNIISENEGRGFFMIIDCSPIIQNNIIAKNAEALNISVSRPRLVNNTIVENINGIYGRDISRVFLTNSILWHEVDISLDNHAEAIVTYSLIRNGWPGEGNLTQEPLFIGGGDYHLSENSLCIDTGTSAGAPDIDIGGTSRPQGSGYDMGAYEFIRPVIPTVTTKAATLVTANSASSGGNITSDGGASVTARGVCWSTSANPTTSDSKTTDGSGGGSFSSSITGLVPGSAYHVRAYATNSAGTGYGSDVSFTTSYSSTLYVSSNGDCGDKTPCYTTIREAINAADSVTLIKVTEGTYDEALIINEPKNLTIQGSWDSTFTSRTSDTTIRSMRISAGSVKTEYLVIQ